jgi:hypothetical protein
VWSSSVHWLEGAADGRPQGAQQPVWRRLVAPSPTVQEMVMQCLGWCWGRRGRLHRTDGNGGDRTRRRDVMAFSLCGRDVVVRLSFEGSAVPFRGCGTSVVWEWVAQCHGVVAGHAAQRRTMAGMASPGELVEQCRGVIPRRVVAWIRF